MTRLVSGEISVAVLTKMPGVTGAMFEWWMGWHYMENQRYKLCTTKLEPPSLQVVAERDPWILAAAAVATQMTCSDVEVHRIAEAEHWTLLEQPEALPKIMIDWLTC